MPARYTFIGTLASGGMGTVFLARMAGSAGFSRLVAVKRLLPELAAQRDFVTMLVDEARLASQIRHVNVIDTLDLVASDGAFSIVLEYVEGAALSSLIGYARRANEPIPAPIALAIMHGVLRGLDAAHEARGPDGQSLGIVHRDVSPQNVLVGVDGVPRVIDFGVAKAMGRMTATRPGEVRGKFAYMAPEQFQQRPVTRQVDVYAAGVMLWELLTGERLFKLDDQRAVMAAVLRGDIRPPSEVNPAVPRELDPIVLKATARDVSDRYLTARELAEALSPWDVASEDEVGAWVRRLAAPQLAKTHALLNSVAPEPSRSVDDLLQELARSATPSIPDGSGLYPAAPEPAGRDLGPGSARGLTSAGIAVPSPASGVGARPASNRAWMVLAAMCTLGVVGLVLGLVALSRGRALAARRELAPPTSESAAPPVVIEAAPVVFGPSSSSSESAAAIELASAQEDGEGVGEGEEDEAPPAASSAGSTQRPTPAPTGATTRRRTQPTKRAASAPLRDKDLDHR